MGAILPARQGFVNALALKNRAVDAGKVATEETYAIVLDLHMPCLRFVRTVFAIGVDLSLDG
jgi:hypothetical protein